MACSVFLANLLLNEGAADQLLECALRGENAHSGLRGIEHREAYFVVHVTGQDGLIVDHGDDAVEDDSWAARAAEIALAGMPEETGERGKALRIEIFLSL